MRHISFLLASVILLHLATPVAAQNRKENNSAAFFKPVFKNGEKLGNVFSRTISYKGSGFPEIAQRVGGTAVYTVLDNNPLQPVFTCAYRYDGRPEGSSKLIVSDQGRTYNYDGNAAANTDASGVMFNPFIWGTPPEKIHAGSTWQVNIPKAWELGGAGIQTVRVVRIDEENQVVTLLREGSSEGFYDNDARQINVPKEGKNVKMDITPGTSHWIGYTTFKNGLVISDELLVTRPVTLVSGDAKFEGQQREYILLNAMPVVD